MKPRLESSKKWTNLPSELTTQIREIISQHFSEPLAQKKIECEGRIYSKELLVKVSVITPKQLRQDNFFSSQDYNKKKDNVLNMVHLSIDCLGSMLEQFFSSEDLELPLDWHEYDLDENKKIHLLYTTDNEDLESQADQLLGEHPEDEGDLLKGSDSEQDISTVKKIMGIDEDS